MDERPIPAAALHIQPFTIGGPIAREDLAGLCDRACRLLCAGDPHVVWCDVRGVGADAVAVDALARLQLAARRVRCRIVLSGASSELLALVTLMGLEEVLPGALEQARGAAA